MRIVLMFFVTALPLITTYAIVMTLAVIRRGKLIRELEERMRGLNEPELWLPRVEREEHARKLLRREDEQYENQQLEKYTQIIRGQR